jgi:hypothetical protein
MKGSQNLHFRRRGKEVSKLNLWRIVVREAHRDLGFGFGRRARGGVPSRSAQFSAHSYPPQELAGLSETACGNSTESMYC